MNVAATVLQVFIKCQLSCRQQQQHTDYSVTGSGTHQVNSNHLQDAVPTTKIEQLCSSADANYGFTCTQIFTKTFKGFSTTVSAVMLLHCLQ